MAHRLSELLRPERIALGVHVRDKADLFNEIAALAHRALPGVGSQEVREALEERERLATTAIGDGIAVPHGKVRAVGELSALLVTAPDGVDFGASDGKKVEIVLALLAPPAAGDPLKALAKMSRILRDGGFRRKLLQSSAASEVWDLVKSHEASR